MNLRFTYIILSLVGVVMPAMSQDELPTPEAFADECKADMIFYLQQMNGVVRKIEDGSEPNPQLAEEFNIARARLNTKAEYCEMTSKLLGPKYKTRLDQIVSDSELKLAMYKLVRTMEKIRIENPLKKDMKSSNRLNSQRKAYIMSIRSKIERNWLKPAGSEQMPDCEVKLQQAPDGLIFGVSFGECGGTAIYRESIENAIRRSDPLPLPPDPALFQREITLIFKSDE
jgi:colicin import membrane protein